jgi:hypothetical protein
MPTRVPTLLINGATGIAVGMATNMPSQSYRSNQWVLWRTWIITISRSMN